MKNVFYQANKTPSDGRSRTSAWRFAFAVVALTHVPSAASAQTSSSTEGHLLNEERVIEISKYRSAPALAATANEALADTLAGVVAQLPNPTLGWETETVLGDQESAQDMFRLNVPINVARPLSQQSLARSGGELMKAQAALSRSDAIVAALFSYYDVVLGRQQVGLLKQAVTNLEEAARVLKLREQEGTASGYESLRLSLASELVHADLAEAQGALEGSERALRVLLRLEGGSLAVPRTLRLHELPNESVLVQRASSGTKSLKATKEASEAAEIAKDRASWGWVPQVNLMGGLNRVELNQTAWGYIAGVTVGVPLFNSGGAFRDAADARAQVAEARRTALSTEALANLQRALAVHRRSSAALERLSKNTTKEREELLLAAQSGYREGRRTIVELLDAQRARTEAVKRRLRLLEIAKKSEVQARAAAGEFQ